MTDATDRDTKLRAVAARFLGWEPGKMCELGGIFCKQSRPAPPESLADVIHDPHEIPPPDPADPAVRVALEDALLKQSVSIAFDPVSDEDVADGRAVRSQIVYCLAGTQIFWSGAYNDPADALLDAAYQLVRGEGGR